MTLPPRCHATVVAEGLGPIRHLAVRGNGNVYLSTPQNQDPSESGIMTRLARQLLDSSRHEREH